ncbi:extracellular solute-binding protein [Kineococcus sp. SYSU DK004]|uniref:extracellular solute-binding protein n=1 Tax=Kineococcus sp. SYSU DK004 TaxID=3383125 RepID=UPI003D7D679D
MRRTWRAALSGAGAAALAAGALTACGSSAGTEGTPILTWYINPDAGGQQLIAQQCSDASGGRYVIDTAILPTQAPAQREQLVRRLAANDSSIDLMSLDPVYVPEFANAGYLAPIPPEAQEQLTEGIVEGAVQSSTWEDELVAVPFWANTQLLWFKRSAAEAAGLDTEQPVTWQQLIDAAASQDTAIGVQGTRAESMTVWVNALVESAGGAVLEDPEAPADELEVTLDSEAGRAAAEVVQAMDEAGVLGPGIDNRDEAATADLFEQGRAAFMVNWPFVYARAQTAVEGGTLEQSVLDDYGWAQYPAVADGQGSAPPVGGISLGIGAFTEHPEEALEAATCIAEPEKQKQYMLSDGNPAAAQEVYDDPEVVEAFPMAGLIRDSLEAAAPRPKTPYYNEVSGGIQQTWQPASAVDPATTPEESAEFIQQVLRGERLL